jgi:hypothetical protein
MRTLIAALLMAATAWAQSQAPAKTAPEQGPPPKNLTVRPDGHVSANQDPTNPDKFEVHMVKQGETLSQIAGEALSNPRLWPQLWEQNDHIINPHWIYPNDKILIKPVTVLSEAKPPEPEPTPEPAPPPVLAKPEPQIRPVQLPPPTPPAQQQQPPAQQQVLVVEDRKPVSQIKFEDLYCSGSVRTMAYPENLKVIAKFDATGAVLATDTEYVYLSQGAGEGIMAGNTYQVVRPTIELTNPYSHGRSDHNLGLHYLDVAQLRVVLVQPEFSLARVLHSCADAVEVGDLLVPFEQIRFPEPGRPRPFSPTMSPVANTTGGVTGSIVSTKDVMLNFGSSYRISGMIPGVRYGHLGPLERGIASEGTIVYIDLGQEKGVKPGDVFIVYRFVELDERLYPLPKEVRRLRNARMAIGEVVVVKTGERASTALVTYATDGLTLGDMIEKR